MLCLSLPSDPKQIDLKPDLIELRLDLFKNLSLQTIKRLKEGFSCPVIFTLKTNDLRQIKAFATLQPDYLDLDHTIKTPLENEFPKIKWICSYHNYHETPQNLEEIWRKLKQKPAHLYKIACHARSTLDSLRLLDFVRSHPNVLGLCMGEKGQITRILGPLFGNQWTFVAQSQASKTAKGQLTIDEMHSKYRPLSSQTALFGLIGSPVSQSPSDQTHNQLMKKLQLDALYVKMQVEPHELKQTLQLAQKLGFQGLSVTAPLKEKIVEYLDKIDPIAQKIGAVNTLLLHNGDIYGTNTDGIGALDALEKREKVAGKKMVILGAGGAARAIVFEALRRGARVVICNRTLSRAQKLADEFGAQATTLGEIETYDILIHTTPHLDPLPNTKIFPNTTVMDISLGTKATPLLDKAKSKGCVTIKGFEMFLNQAVGQFSLWFPNLNQKKISSNMVEF